MRAFDASMTRLLRITCGCIFGSLLRAPLTQDSRGREAYTNLPRLCQLFAGVASAERSRPRLSTFYAARGRCILSTPNMPTSETVSDDRTRPSFRVKLAVVASSLATGLLIFEVFLRAVGFTYPVFYEPDTSRGYALRPDMQGWYRKEGEAFVLINSDGLRDREHTKVKPPETFRIAVVGDSYAEAFQVAQSAAFWSVME